MPTDQIIGIAFIAIGCVGLGVFAFFLLRANRLPYIVKEAEAPDYREGGVVHHYPRPYGVRHPGKIVLTPAMIGRVNLARRKTGRPALNRQGVKNAIAYPYGRPALRSPETSNDWLTYLIMYEVLFDGHTQSECGVGGTVLIDPGKPYNGQGGEFAGAGASGDWTSAPSPVVAAAAAIDPFIVTNNYDGKYSPGDTVGGYDSAPSSMNPDPAPSYSAPDPTPSYDSGSSSSSYDSGPSSSSSDSGSSGGGDGG